MRRAPLSNRFLDIREPSQRPDTLPRSKRSHTSHPSRSTTTRTTSPESRIIRRYIRRYDPISRPTSQTRIRRYVPIQSLGLSGVETSYGRSLIVAHREINGTSSPTTTATITTVTCPAPQTQVRESTRRHTTRARMMRRRKSRVRALISSIVVLIVVWRVFVSRGRSTRLGGWTITTARLS